MVWEYQESRLRHAHISVPKPTEKIIHNKLGYVKTITYICIEPIKTKQNEKVNNATMGKHFKSSSNIRFYCNHLFCNILI